MAEIYIDQEADDKLTAYLQAIQGEISGFGTGKNTGSLFIIDDIFILPQESGSAHTELDTDAMQDLLWQMIKNGKDPERICVWWHSHGNSASFMSPTDDAAVEKFADFGRPWMISIVSNRKLEHKCQIDFYQPVRAGIEDVTIKRIPDLNSRMVKRIKKEVEKKVRKPPKPDPKKGGAVVVSGHQAGLAGLTYPVAGLPGADFQADHQPWRRTVYGDGKKDEDILSVGDTVLFLDTDEKQQEGSVDGFLLNPPRVRISRKVDGSIWFVPQNNLVKISGPEEEMLTAGSGGHKNSKKKKKKGGR